MSLDKISKAVRCGTGFIMEKVKISELEDGTVKAMLSASLPKVIKLLYTFQERDLEYSSTDPKRGSLLKDVVIDHERGTIVINYNTDHDTFKEDYEKKKRKKRINKCL